VLDIWQTAKYGRCSGYIAADSGVRSAKWTANAPKPQKVLEPVKNDVKDAAHDAKNKAKDAKRESDKP
jgi:hypothetical protein